jgi:hypothetical protein
LTDDRTPLAELRRDVVAAFLVFATVGLGALCVVTLMNF